MVPARRVLIAVLTTACAAALIGAGAAGARTVWLCKPGMAHDPCTPGLNLTRFTPSETKTGTKRVATARNPKVDCFYVYPTVSDQPPPNANLHIDPVERSMALYQAGYFSRECRVFAPMYRQFTTIALVTPGSITPQTILTAYADVRAAWRDYLAHDNHGRGVVLIGHSQGSLMLRTLITQEIDSEPSVRKRLVSAVLLGGNVLVKAGRDVGGDFRHVRGCRSRTQLGCVVAYSSFNAPVPANSLFGRPAAPGLQVLCTNPAALGGGSGTLDALFPRQPFAQGSIAIFTQLLLGGRPPAASTPWLELPNSYRARCSSTGGASVLQVTGAPGARTLHPSPDATWGLHLADFNIALGNLVDLVHSEAAAFTAAHR